MDSLFSDQFRRDLAGAVERRRDNAPHTVDQLKSSLRSAIRRIERNEVDERPVRNQADFPGAYFAIVGAWQLIYRVADDDGTIEFLALRNIAL